VACIPRLPRITPRGRHYRALMAVRQAWLGWTPPQVRPFAGL